MINKPVNKDIFKHRSHRVTKRSLFMKNVNFYVSFLWIYRVIEEKKVTKDHKVPKVLRLVESCFTSNLTVPIFSKT